MSLVTRPTPGLVSQLLRVAATVALVGWASAAGATTITVTTTDDEVNQDGDCSLREAVRAANTDAAVDACTAGEDGQDAIVFAGSLGAGTITLGQAAIAVTDSLSISGGAAGGATVSVSGTGVYQIFRVTGGELSLNSLRLTQGTAVSGGAVYVASGASLVTDDVRFVSNTATGAAATEGGGAIYVDGGGAARLANSTFDGNTATGSSGSGGAVFLNGAAGARDSVVVIDSRFVNNTANRAGGAIENRDGALRIEDTDFDLNRAGANPGNGGAIHLSASGMARVTGGAVTNNTAAAEGGGFWNSSAEMTVVGTEFTGNRAAGNAASNGGGALYNNGGVLDLVDVTVQDNAATGTSGSGGGLLNNGGTLLLTTSTVTGNEANRAGGGLEDAAGTSILIMSDFTANDAGTNPGNGGAVHTGGGTVVVGGGNYLRNDAVEGGGLWSSGTLVVSGNTDDMTRAMDDMDMDDMMDRMNDTNVQPTLISQNEATGADAAQGGGGLYNQGGTMLVLGDPTDTDRDDDDSDTDDDDLSDDLDNSVVISENVASGRSGSGGGILNNGGTLTVRGAAILSNEANRAGAGIEDAGGVVTLEDVAVRANAIATARPGNGGGLHSGGGDVTIRGGVYSNNTAVEGGGLWSNGTLTINAEVEDDSSAVRGRATRITNNTATGAMAGTGGGGVYAETGADVTITGAVIEDNAATGASGSGGGLLVADGASVSVFLGSISNNQANRAGGGIELFDDVLSDDPTTVSLSKVSVLDNEIATPAPGNGGGLHAGGGAVVTADQSTFANNSATEGGGLWINVDGRLTLSNSTVSGNAATGDGGGVYDNGGARISVSSATVADNTAGANGGGFVSESTGRFSFQNTILANNDASTGDDCFGTFQSGGFNLIESTQNCTIRGTTASNIVGADPALAPLADNGGPTQTRALMQSSRAINNGQSEFDVDQRGLQRRFTPDDIGAFELGGAPVATDTPGGVEAQFGLEAPAPNPARGAATVRFTVQDAEPVELAVYNVLGQKVLTAFDGPATPGTEQVMDLDLGGLASGVYVLRLTGTTDAATRRITVVR